MTGPPQSPEAEDAVLGTIALVGGDVIPRITETGLRPEHFYRREWGKTFQECLREFDQGKPVDVITVPDLDGHAGGVPNLGNVLAYARTVKEKARWRDVLQAGHLLTTAAFTEDPLDLAEAERLLQADLETETAYSKDRLAELLWNRLEQGAPVGYSMPLFDKLRLRKGTVQLWGGHTSHGKTVWVDQCGRALAKQDARVVLWLNEMTAEERMCRWAAAVTGISLEAIEDGTLSGSDKARVVKAMKAIPFEIIECAGWDIDRIKRDIRTRKPDVAIVDIIHEIPYRDERDLADIMRALTSTSKIANVAIIATVHLNRSRNEGAARPRPVMSDIKGASAFEQGADLVGMVWREDDPLTGRPTEIGQIYLLKNRQGRFSGVDVTLDGDLARFERTLI